MMLSQVGEFIQRYGVNVTCGTEEDMLPSTFTVQIRCGPGPITSDSLLDACDELERQIITHFPALRNTTKG